MHGPVFLPYGVMLSLIWVLIFPSINPFDCARQHNWLTANRITCLDSWYQYSLWVSHYTCVHRRPRRRPSSRIVQDPGYRHRYPKEYADALDCSWHQELHFRRERLGTKKTVRRRKASCQSLLLSVIAIC